MEGEFFFFPRQNTIERKVKKKVQLGHFFRSRREPSTSASCKKRTGVPLEPGGLRIPFAMRRTAAVVLETCARARSLLELNASSSSSSTFTSSSSTSSSSFAAASSSAPSSSTPSVIVNPIIRCCRRRSYWNDGYQRFGDHPRRVGGNRGGGGRRGRGGGNQQQHDPRSTFRAKPRLVSLLGGATLAAGSVVYYTSRETVPYTQRRHSILVSQDLEKQLGEATFAQIVQEAKATRRLLPRNHPLVHQVERIGRRLASVAADGGGGGACDHMKGLDWVRRGVLFPFFRFFFFRQKSKKRYPLIHSLFLSLSFEQEFIVVDDPGNVNAMVAPGKEGREKGRGNRGVFSVFLTCSSSFFLSLLLLSPLLSSLFSLLSFSLSSFSVSSLPPLQEARSSSTRACSTSWDPRRSSRRCWPTRSRTFWRGTRRRS